MKYGIFEANFETKKKITDSWNVVDGDENIGHPIKVFDNPENAIEKLFTETKYAPDVNEFRNSGIKYYNYTFYFVAGCEVDEDLEEDEISIEDYCPGSDGCNICGIFREDYPEKYKPSVPKISKAKFFIDNYEDEIFDGVKVTFSSNDTIYIENATVDEAEAACVFVNDKMNIENLEEKFYIHKNDPRFGDEITEIQ